MTMLPNIATLSVVVIERRGWITRVIQYKRRKTKTGLAVLAELFGLGFQAMVVHYFVLAVGCWLLFVG